jgi:S-adenosylmethionine:tRNA ribosyltransferase-isomerase
LHFTNEVLEALDRRGIVREEVTLHVGAGTFKPVRTDFIGRHVMHAEWFAVERATVARLIEHPGCVTAVGTTSVRALESLYFVGEALGRGASEEGALSVKQWAPYVGGAARMSTEEALRNVLGYLDGRGLDRLVASTRIMIVPGYRFRVVNHLITNFHQPGSTLLLLVSAFAKGDWRRIYDFALEHDFRFLSYGDCSLMMDY